MSATPLDIRNRSPSRLQNESSSAAGSPIPAQHSRHVSIARLSSPVPSNRLGATPQQSSTPSQQQQRQPSPASRSPLAGLETDGSLPRPGQSALSSALATSFGQLPPPVTNTPPAMGPLSGLSNYERLPRSNYGSFPNRETAGSPAPAGDPEIVKRHLVQPEEGARHTPAGRVNLDGISAGLDDGEFSSLQLQGGDMTRNVYKWAEEAEGSVRGRSQRSQSFNVKRPEPEEEVLNIHSIRMPGGFRRDFLRRVPESPAPSDREPISQTNSRKPPLQLPKQQPQLFTNNFLEFLTLYGHFAGEQLDEDDEDLGPDEYFSSDAFDDYQDGDEEPGEGSALLTPATPGGKRKRKHKERAPTGTGSPLNAVLLLLKSFVGTGVLFLPRAFLNGGMLFSSLVLLGIAAVSYLCFILLIATRSKIEASYGDIGGVLYGKWMRAAILFSIVLSQLGFVSAYTVFTAENLQAFVSAVSKCRTFIDIKIMIVLQLIIFLPLSLIRDISKLGFTALIADAFILLGLIYLYYYDIYTVSADSFKLDIALFNPSSWTLLIGTAIFTFEGVGLIIPIQESMKQPQKFPFVLGLVMVIITVLFTSIGALSYTAYGSKTKTVVLLNLPQDDKMVNGVQFLYSLAILLSTPLQLFPAIRIMENELFSRSGKYNPYIKWQKNIFRFFLVILCALVAWGGADDLDKFVALVGSFACVPLVYIYPPLLHLKAVAKTPWQRGLDYLICTFGVIGCAYTTALTVQQWAGSSIHDPGYCDH
jgi:solute carrier family 36 (proton-coupled amino acid transporter)